MVTYNRMNKVASKDRKKNLSTFHLIIDMFIVGIRLINLYMYIALKNYLMSLFINTMYRYIRTRTLTA